ncbi:hypothetical protein D3C72_1342350 [compost metagenome]
MLEALATPTRFSSRAKDTGEALSGGWPEWMCQTALSICLAGSCVLYCSMKDR